MSVQGNTSRLLLKETQMKFFDFLKPRRNRTLSWNELPDEKKRRFTSFVSSAVKNLAGARYKIVSGADEWQRERGVVETKGEDEILDYSKRGKLLDLARNAARNNSTFNTILKQFDLQGVGTNGGKAVLTFKDREFSKKVKNAFSKWTRNADFFDGLNLNTLLKLILKTELIGGDLVILFDDNLITDSGRILVYEPDEIGNTTEEALQRRYGQKAYQSQGRVYTPFGQFQGVIVSRSQRGCDVFDPDKCYFLHRDPNGSSFDDKWLMPRNIFRVGQGRGVTPTTSSLSTIIDLNDYVGFEIAAAKKNAQTLGTISDTREREEISPPSAFPDDVDFSDMSDEEIDEVAKQVSDECEKTVSLDQIKAAGVIYQQLPEGYRLDLLDTKHPNQNAIEFVRWLASMSAAPFGLTSVYSTLKVDSSYSGYMGERAMCIPVWEETQKFLEQICDWILYRWSSWAVRKGIIEDRFEEDWIQNVSWLWPKQGDIDSVKEQNAISLKLKNGTGSYREIYGADWQEKLESISEEIEFCRQRGIPHPALQTVSGAVIDAPQKEQIETEE